MGIDFKKYERLRPYLYHLTAKENVDGIRETRELKAASKLIDHGGRADLIGTRRRNHVTIEVGGREIRLRDQAPLHLGNMKLDEGWSFERFIDHLNARVFFWPGTDTGPISYGVRHFERYAEEKPAIVRIRFADLLHLNPMSPMFCRCNSGSPRWSRGVPAPRGPLTFVAAEEAHFTESQVVEVTILDHVILPNSTEIGLHPSGPWRTMFNEPLGT